MLYFFSFFLNIFSKNRNLISFKKKYKTKQILKFNIKDKRKKFITHLFRIFWFEIGKTDEYADGYVQGYYKTRTEGQSVMADMRLPARPTRTRRAAAKAPLRLVLRAATTPTTCVPPDVGSLLQGEQGGGLPLAHIAASLGGHHGGPDVTWWVEEFSG